MRRVAVIGSGPAGLSAARAAEECGAVVTVFEARRKVGAKLLVSGAGKCNFTNILTADELALRFGGSWRFMMPALRRLPPEKLVAMLAERGVSSHLTDGFFYFPDSESAVDVLNALRPGRAVFETDAAVIDILVSGDGAVRGVRCADGREFAADAVVAACGGVSWPQLGDVSGVVYLAAKKLGHRIVSPSPALVQLSLDGNPLGGLSGMVLDDAALTFGRLHTRGTVLFTHDGISGPAALDISGAVLAETPPSAVLKLAWRAEMDFECWEKFFIDGGRTAGRRQAVNVLGGLVPVRAAALLAVMAGMEPGTLISELTSPVRRKLSHLLAEMEFRPRGGGDWTKAMATRGGIDLHDISSGSLESKLIRNLFFAGEMVDLDGPCGGYNIQWACSSGFLAGRNAAAGC
ncbi:MAG: aminoacetone oxidase family FAD-binding enzyme [Victivallaceae bacterium]|nr:aminoacetone oxidase family FAD-binding enzyme [Victivallaceae bacterium]